VGTKFDFNISFVYQTVSWLVVRLIKFISSSLIAIVAHTANRHMQTVKLWIYVGNVFTMCS